MSSPPDRDHWYDIGPHGFFDLVRLARRGRTTLVRVLYLLLLFAVLYVVHQHFNRPLITVDDVGARINQNARIAVRFSYAILIAQFAAVLVLMPIYIAASVHEDRENRTFSLLFTTQLTARAILQGKLLARVGQVGSVVFAGLPLFALVQLWGGVDMPMIVANFWNVGLWLISVAAFSLMIATHAATMMRSVLLTYFCLAGPLCFCCLPAQASDFHLLLIEPQAGVADGYFKMFQWMGWLTLAHFCCSMCFLQRAIVNLEASRSTEPIPINEQPNEFDGLPNRFLALPEMGDNVIAWKERFLYRGLGHLIPLILLPALFVFLVALAGPGFGRTVGPNVDPRGANELMDFLEFVLLASFGLYVFLVTLGTTGCIVRERQQQTLDGLLLLPIARRELLRSKLIGNLLRYWVWLAIALVYWLALTFFGTRPFYPNVVLLTAMTIHLGFFALLGLFLSVISRTSLSAYISLAFVAFILLAGTKVAIWFFNPSEFQHDLLKGLNPVNCWLEIAAESWPAKVFVSLFCLAIYAAAGAALWRTASRRFEREPSLR